MSGPFYREVIFDASHRDVPKDVKDCVRKLWADYCLGNDNSYFSCNLEYIDEEDWDEYSVLYNYLQDKGQESVLVHLWW